jgi:hypothetical protein
MEYRSTPFPFEEIKNPGFTTKLKWKKEILEGYLNTWSAVQNYIAKENENPVRGLMKKISAIIKEDRELQISFPIFMRIGKIKK